MGLRESKTEPISIGLRGVPAGMGIGMGVSLYHTLGKTSWESSRLYSLRGLGIHLYHR